MELKEFFECYPKVAIAFSGGVDSAYLLYEAYKNAKEIAAYYVKSEFQPNFEYEDALRVVAEIEGGNIAGIAGRSAAGIAGRSVAEIAGRNATETEWANETGIEGKEETCECKKIKLRVIEKKVLYDQNVWENSANRCYYCKRKIFASIRQAASEDGFEVLLDGTNASDDAGDRPGMKALQEMQVLSPLRECGITKEEIRRLSKEAGLFTWDKPAYACLATRIPYGEEITEEKLRITEKAENYLFSKGFSDFRVRCVQGHARIQLREEQWDLLRQNRKDILAELSKYYKSVTLDLAVR